MSLRVKSKQEFALRGPKIQTDELRNGCLQRIADATEAMAVHYERLIIDRDRYRRWYQDEQRKRKSRDRSNAALRGVITKLKKKIQQIEGEADE